MGTSTLLGGIAVQRGLTLWRSQACSGTIVCGSRASARSQAHYEDRSGMLSVVGEPARLYLAETSIGARVSCTECARMP